MPTPEESKRAGHLDVSDFGEKDLSGAYEPGTTFELPDGTQLDPAKVPDWLGKGKRGPGRPRPRPKA